MFKYLKEYRFYIILFFFVLIPIISIDTSQRAPRDYRFYDRAIVWVTYIPQATISWVLDNVVTFYHDYIYLWRTRKENTQMFEENRKLLNTIVNLQETQEENRRLRKLLRFKEDFNLKTVAARVIAKDVSQDFRAIRINRGEAAGIKKDMAVMGHEGVIGRVLRTTKHTADIVTILDALSAIDVLVQRSRVRGIVEGLTKDRCELKFALRTDDIQVGDVLLSSGLGGIFPKGIRVGKVLEVRKQRYGITQKVEVDPSVNFARLEEVLVITEASSSPVHASKQAVLPPLPDPVKMADAEPEAETETESL